MKAVSVYYCEGYYLMTNESEKKAMKRKKSKWRDVAMILMIINRWWLLFNRYIILFYSIIKRNVPLRFNVFVFVLHRIPFCICELPLRFTVTFIVRFIFVVVLVRYLLYHTSPPASYSPLSFYLSPLPASPLCLLYLSASLPLSSLSPAMVILLSDSPLLSPL